MDVQGISLYRQTLAERQRRYDTAISTGQFSPYIYPRDSLPALWLFLAMIIFPRLPKRLVKVLRYPVFILILGQCIQVARHCRSLDFAGGYGIGLICAWGVIMSAVFLLFNDLNTDYQRLETRPMKEENHPVEQANGHATSIESSDDPSGFTAVNRKAVDTTHLGFLTARYQTQSPEIEAQYGLVWQRYPKGVYHAIDWTLDLMTAFRGVNWNFRSQCLPIDLPVPALLSKSNETSTSHAESTATTLPKRSLKKLQLYAIKEFMFYYLLIDLLKTIMVTDPYFLGLAPLSSPTPWSWLSHLSDLYGHHTVRFVRLIISLTGIISALSVIFSLCPLFFTVILPALIEPSKITRCPILELSMYPPYWQPLSQSVLKSGLPGLWGKFWHQLFRYGISDPSRYLIVKLGIQQKGSSARIVRVLIAFLLSGCIHASAAFTAFSLHPSRPISGPLAFFLTQGIGCIGQPILTASIHNRFPFLRSQSAYIGQTANALFVLGYLYLTGPLLSNDFARCGIWLFEPLPISLLRGMGFGPGGKDEGWWCWYQDGSRWVGWWPPNREWQSGSFSWIDRGIAVY